MTTCPRCERPNGAKRRYCGGCGLFLAPACRTCDFSNDSDDQFCGGCGGELVGPCAASLGAHPADVDELRDLFAPFTTAATESSFELPETGVTQSDLDRLFGAAS